ncbi:ATP-binding protein [Geothrix sp.]|jgi:heavy metal sensor kinase|uniref:sensor histidine kinase n=1 Tax=Geothrix sp. TaxID=1962974 RepID=UPI0025BC35F2|nr:ATP-binding protein [Geothrix sp.]
MKTTGTLRFRLTAWYSLTLLAVLTVFGAMLYAVVHHHLLHHHDEPLRASAYAILKIIDETEDCHILTDRQVEQLGKIGKLALIHETQGERRVFFDSPELSGSPLEPVLTTLPLKNPSTAQFEALEKDGAFWRVLSLPYQVRSGRKGIIRVVEDMGDIRETLEALRLGLLILAPLGVLVSSLGGYWLAGKALAPMERITIMAQEIEASSLHRRLTHPGKDSEIGRLVETLNRMFSRLDSSFESMKRFTADASHELRSPLATVRNAIDITLKRHHTPEEHEATLKTIGAEVDRLSSTVEDLLLLARADSGRLVVHLEPVRLDQILEAQVDAFLEQAESSGLHLSLRYSEAAIILGNERWLHLMIGNLIGNALKFTPAPGEVIAQTHQADGSIYLIIEDSGPGIPPEDLEKIFDRFYRSDPARSQATAPGTGLGLAIAAWVSSVHGAEIRASNRAKGGARFTVRFHPHSA